MSRVDLVNYVIIFGIIVVVWGIAGQVVPGLVCFFRPHARRWVVIAGVLLALGLFGLSFTGSDPDGDLGAEGVLLAGFACVFIVVAWTTGAWVGSALGRRRANETRHPRRRQSRA